MKRDPRAVMALAMACATFYAQANCGSGFCLVNTHWQTQGVWTEPGWRVDLRYEYINQDHAWYGDHSATPAEINFDPGKTVNRNLIATLDYAFARDWGVTLRVPYVSMRNIVDIDPNYPDPNFDFGLNTRSHYETLGDIEIMFNHNLVTDHESATGLIFGLKLPTGATDRIGDFLYLSDTLVGGGTPIERTLQPGTGSLDGILGVYHHRALGADFSLHAQAAWREAVRHDDAYQPGRRISADAGISYHGIEPFTFSLQVAGSLRGRDSGDGPGLPLDNDSDGEIDSGTRTVAVSPGISVDVTPEARVYLFYQQPLYRYTNGLQAVADASWVSGISLRF
jgi:hypothetical protein